MIFILGNDFRTVTIDKILTIELTLFFKVKSYKLDKIL